MPQLLPRFQGQSLAEIRKAAREAPGIDDMPRDEKPVSAGQGMHSDAIRLRGIPAIGACAGEIPGTRPDRAVG